MPARCRLTRYQIWRRFVSSRKARSAKEVLQKSLFMLNPVFRVALVRMRTVSGGWQRAGRRAGV